MPCRNTSLLGRWYDERSACQLLWRTRRHRALSTSLRDPIHGVSICHCFVCGGLIGGVVALCRILPSKTLRWLSVAYIWLFQSTPLLMLLFILGLGVPRLLGVDVNPWVAASFALTIYASAYFADVWRGALESVPSGQWEGGYALGLRFFQVLRKIT